MNHTTSFTYNARGQRLVTTHPPDPNDGQRHTITNDYYPDGTLHTVTDELNHVTSYTYDDYRRVRSVTTPGHDTPLTAYSYYDANGTGDDYTHANSNVTHFTSPSGKKTTASYDENYRKISIIVADGTSDAAKTSYGYDNVGNVTSIIAPKGQPGEDNEGTSTVTAYDERNRVMSVTDALGNPTTIQYDAAGRKKSVTRANGQIATFDSYDAMNRLLQQTVQQAPDPDAVTKYTYYTSGLLHTMQDPRLVANASAYSYSYDYDLLGRKTGLTYPPDSGSVQRTEAWHYDTAGRNDTFTNRAGKIETFHYDALNRLTNGSWNDGLTPAVAFGYDAASRTTSIVNANATISRTYFHDNSLHTETTTYADTTARTVTYSYDADGNRSTIQYPNSAYSFTYNYTNRNQLQSLVSGSTVISYGYDPNGNLVTRTPANSTSSTYSYDALNRVTGISHTLVGTTRTLAYDYDSVGNRKWTKRDNANGDVFGYDANDQVTAVKLNIANPDTTAPGSQTIIYDANGNRVSFAAYGTTDNYATNDLNEYTTRNGTQAVHNANGATTTGLDGSGTGGGPNLVSNAGFENGSNVAPWTKTGNCWADNFSAPHSGNYYFAFNGGQTSPNGVVSQVINTTPGTSYTVKFWHGILVYNQTATQRINVTVKNASNGILAGPQTFALTATAGTTTITSWQQDSITFTADGATATIQFADDASNPTINTDLILDDAEVTVTDTTNLVGTPGFENGSNVAPWTKTGNCWADNFSAPHSGNYYFAFNGGQTSPNGVVSQVINTTPGTSYTVKFWHGILVYNQTATQRINVTVKNASNGILIGPLNFSRTATAGTTTITSWQQESITFTADGATATIQFADDASNPTINTDLILDDVSMAPDGGSSSPPSTYTYDAQNRLLTATKNGTTETFTYDGLNRQVTRKIGTASPLYNVYDGWDLIAEYNAGSSIPLNAYLNGAGGLVKNLTANIYYYQDASGSTSHVANAAGALLEWYRYDLHGTPIFYDSSNTQISGSNYGIRHLFTGQQWYSDIGLYDLRNRFYSPDLGRFVQPDPIGFEGDATNLYRYCGNNPVNWFDPVGTYGIVKVNGSHVEITIPIVYVGPPGQPGPSAAQIATFNSGIMSQLSGTVPGGRYTVTTTVVDGSNWANPNVITVYQGAGPIASTEPGGTTGTWYAGGLEGGITPGYEAAHEAIHLLGPIDEYVRDTQGTYVGPLPGWEGTMLGGPGGQLTEQDVQAIIDAQNQPQSFFGKVWNSFVDLFKRATGNLGQGGGRPVVTYSPTFGFSQSTFGSPGGYPEYGPTGGNALGGTFSPAVLGELGLGGGPPNLMGQQLYQ